MTRREWLLTFPEPRRSDIALSIAQAPYWGRESIARAVEAAGKIWVGGRS